MEAKGQLEREVAWQFEGIGSLLPQYTFPRFELKSSVLAASSLLSESPQCPPEFVLLLYPFMAPCLSG